MYPISAFTRAVAPGGDYPYGTVANDPSGTLVNDIMVTDLLQMLQRLLADAGLTPNGSPDNTTNGFQTLQALNQLFQAPQSGWATAFEVTTYGGGTNGTPVILSGMNVTTSGPSTYVEAGYFLYNNQLVWFKRSDVSFGTGSVKQVTITLVDNMPVASAALVASTPYDATHFNLSVAIPFTTQLAIAAGSAGLQTQINTINTTLAPIPGQITAINSAITALNASVTALNNKTANGTWYYITDSAVGGTYNAGWGGTSGGSVTFLQIKLDGSGRVRLRGNVVYTFGVGGETLTIFTLPSGSPYAPAGLETYAVNVQFPGGGNPFIDSVQIITSGGVATATMIRTGTGATNIYTSDVSVQISCEWTNY